MQREMAVGCDLAHFGRVRGASTWLRSDDAEASAPAMASLPPDEPCPSPKRTRPDADDGHGAPSKTLLGTTASSLTVLTAISATAPCT